MLKKEFQKHDVERLRNLIKGKSSSRTNQGVGYTKSSSEDHEEGDVWEENGRTWTIKDGIKENITKLDKFKKSTVPLFCPKCKNVMDKSLDANYYKSYGQCLDCYSVFVTKLRVEGKWDNYVKNNFNKEVDLLIEDYKNFFKEKLAESNKGYVTESGEIEQWLGSIDKDKAEESLNDTIEYLEGLKK
jgi:hypothetical protein